MGVFETLSSEQQSLIQKHLELVIDVNQRVNLTRIDSLEEGMILHVEDSLAGLEELNEAPEGPLGDLGSGAGFPGIPLAIASGRETTLIDARKKKMDVVSEIISELGLSSQINTYSGRAELFARTQSKRFVALTVRALSQLPVLLELASPLLVKNGVLLCYKANVTDEELADAQRVQKMVGMKLVKDRAFILDNEYQRRILTFKKVAEATVKLPRQEGMAQKHPLSE
ncbi:MAG: 16S rRNA (guanine(527)-N(7))-methyltransferase RsmG [Eggerthellaceae bacterium]|nr:16S rRNA (guanine(527)-N(7))-methyltransferase RsmG [Eggerthellaceae bacterium]